MAEKIEYDGIDRKRTRVDEDNPKLVNLYLILKPIPADDWVLVFTRRMQSMLGGLGAPARCVEVKKPRVYVQCHGDFVESVVGQICRRIDDTNEEMEAWEREKERVQLGDQHEAEGKRQIAEKTRAKLDAAIGRLEGKCQDELDGKHQTLEPPQ